MNRGVLIYKHHKLGHNTITSFTFSLIKVPPFCLFTHVKLSMNKA